VNVQHDTADHGAPSTPRQSRLRGRVARLSVLIAVAIVVVDQLTKHWAVNALSDGRSRHVIGSLQWNLTFNSGMAFSRAKGIGPFIGVLAFCVMIGLALSSAKLGSRTARLAAGLLIGGALGNVIDRLFRGRAWLRGSVVDFIDVQWWPIFNVADIAVSVGAVLFALTALRQPSTSQAAP